MKAGLGEGGPRRRALPRRRSPTSRSATTASGTPTRSLGDYYALARRGDRRDDRRLGGQGRGDGAAVPRRLLGGRLRRADLLPGLQPIPTRSTCSPTPPASERAAPGWRTTCRSGSSPTPPSSRPGWSVSGGESEGLWLKIAKKGTPESRASTYARSARAGALLRLDRQPEARPRRDPLPAALHAAPAARPLVADQPRQGRSADRRRAAAPGRCWPRSRRRRPTAAGRPPTRASARAKVPADLRRELDAQPGRRGVLRRLDGANRYAILYRLDEAKKPETRERRLRKFVAMLERGEKIHG